MSERKEAMSTMQSSLRNFEATIDCRLCGQGKEINQHSDTMSHEMATDFQQRMDTVGMDFGKEMGKVHQGQRELPMAVAGGTAPDWAPSGRGRPVSSSCPSSNDRSADNWPLIHFHHPTPFGWHMSCLRMLC